ncbi:MAG TPA: ABC transporter permease, partial [Puia sp.]|nr:ABC transporter permease [Puia sp.]
MIKNYFKTSIRSLLRNKGFTIINISGLTIGMAGAILILLWVQNELSYDHFHANGNRLYQVYSNNEINHSIRSITATPEIMAPILKTDVPEIDEASRVTWQQFHILNVDDKNFRPLGCIVDEPFLQMFSFPLMEGNVQSALRDPYSIVLTEGLARKIFGNADVMGRVIKMDNSDNVKVTGILKDLPNNTLFNFEYLTSYEYNSAKHYVDSDWTDISIATFVMLKPNTSVQTANEKMKDIIPHHSGGNAKTAEFLYPVEKLRLYSNFENGKVVGGRIERVRVFFIIGLFILIVACINFMNLSTARSEKRAREVGVRKVIGAKRNSLVFQFLSESILITLAAAILALLIVQLSLPAFNQLVQERLFIDYGNPYFWLACIGFILFTGFLAGSYPAFLLSSFKPVSVLKGSFKHTSSLWNPRKILVVLQFTFAIVLIISTIVVEQQVEYAQERETGYDKNNLVYIFIQGDIGKNYSLIKNELLSSQVAASVTMGQAPLTQNWSSGISMNWQGKDPNAKIQINRYTEDGNLIKTAGMHLVEGRDIDIKNYPSDSTACLISESAVKAMGFKNPIG